MAITTSWTRLAGATTASGASPSPRTTPTSALSTTSTDNCGRADAVRVLGWRRTRRLVRRRPSRRATFLSLATPSCVSPRTCECEGSRLSRPSRNYAPKSVFKARMWTCHEPILREDADGAQHSFPAKKRQWRQFSSGSEPCAPISGKMSKRPSLSVDGYLRTLVPEVRFEDDVLGNESKSSDGAASRRGALTRRGRHAAQCATSECGDILCVSGEAGRCLKPETRKCLAD